MKNLFCPYELALALKEKGFDESCLGYYHDTHLQLNGFPLSVKLDIEKENIKAPLYQQVIDWFDDVHKIRVDLRHNDANGTHMSTIWKWNFDNNIGKWERIGFPYSYADRIERNNKAIEEALKLIKL